MDDFKKNINGEKTDILAYRVKDAKSTNYEQRRIRFKISSGKIDRHGHIVKPEAVEKAIKAFGSNPICLPCHMHALDNGEPPTVGSWDVDSFKVNGKTPEMDLVFSEGKLGEMYFQEYKAGHMNAVSIGFMVDDSTVEVQSGNRVYVINGLELLEISCVAVGANREALQRKGIVGDSDSTVELIKQMKDELLELIEEKTEQIKLLVCDPDSQGDFDDTDGEKAAGESDGTDDGVSDELDEFLAALDDAANGNL